MSRPEIWGTRPPVSPCKNLICKHTNILFSYVFVACLVLFRSVLVFIYFCLDLLFFCFYCETSKTILDRGSQSDRPRYRYHAHMRWTLTFDLDLDLDFQPQASYGRSFVRYCGQGSSLLWTPALRPLCRSNAPAQGEEGNW